MRQSNSGHPGFTLGPGIPIHVLNKALFSDRDLGHCFGALAAVDHTRNERVLHMNQLTAFQNFLTTHSGEISLTGLAVNMTITALLCAILGWVYVNYGATFSNRSSLARNFVLVGVTTTLIITVVKASPALSLGLVGALSIVRFRTAI